MKTIDEFMDRWHPSPFESVNDDMRHDLEELMEEEARKLKSVMVAAAEEIQEHWQAHCDEEGYGPVNLMHRLENGLSSDYAGYSFGAFTKIKDRLEKLEKGLSDEEIEAIRNLLAVMHGDGGHYTEKHGLLKSITDAQELLHSKWIVKDKTVLPTI